MGNTTHAGRYRYQGLLARALNWEHAGVGASASKPGWLLLGAFRNGDTHARSYGTQTFPAHMPGTTPSLMP